MLRSLVGSEMCIRDRSITCVHGRSIRCGFCCRPVQCRLQDSILSVGNFPNLTAPLSCTSRAPNTTTTVALQKVGRNKFLHKHIGRCLRPPRYRGEQFKTSSRCVCYPPYFAGSSTARLLHSLSLRPTASRPHPGKNPNTRVGIRTNVPIPSNGPAI